MKRERKKESANERANISTGKIFTLEIYIFPKSRKADVAEKKVSIPFECLLLLLVLRGLKVEDLLKMFEEKY